MAKAASVVSVRVEQAVKRDVERLYEGLGMSISAAVNVFFKQCLAEQGLPFQPRVNPQIPPQPPKRTEAE